MTERHELIIRRMQWKTIIRQIPEIHIVKTVLFSNEYQKSRETREILRERESKRERER